MVVAMVVAMVVVVAMAVLVLVLVTVAVRAGVMPVRRASICVETDVKPPESLCERCGIQPAQVSVGRNHRRGSRSCCCRRRCVRVCPRASVGVGVGVGVGVCGDGSHNRGSGGTVS
jgi:hypothetical protein